MSTLTPFIQYEIFHPVLGSDGPLYLFYLECMLQIYKFNLGKTDFVRPNSVDHDERMHSWSALLSVCSFTL